MEPADIFLEPYSSLHMFITKSNKYKDRFDYVFDHYNDEEYIGYNNDRTYKIYDKYTPTIHYTGLTLGAAQRITYNMNEADKEYQCEVLEYCGLFSEYYKGHKHVIISKILKK